MPPLFSLLLLAGLFTETTTERLNLPPVETVERVELDRYLGRWYEIASIPMFFTRGCAHTTALYTRREDGEIDVVNRCLKDGKPSETKGRMRVVDPALHTKFKVSFFRPFWGDYWILDLDENYAWAVVGPPSRDSLWILSRTPTLDAKVYDSIIERLKIQSFETGRLVRTVQDEGRAAELPEDGRSIDR